jgi:RNA polymerase sigma-70 factor (ECF subfamily)
VAVNVQKHEKSIYDAVAQLLARADNARRLNVEDLLPRITKTLEKTFQLSIDQISHEDSKSLLNSLYINDLCLVLACERGDEAAWNDLFANFGSTVRSAARKITSNAEDAEDLANSIWAELHGLRTGTNGKPTGKIAYYSGRGSLAGWLRAVVAQLAVDIHRKQSRFVQIEENREFETLAHEADQKDTIKFRPTEENPEIFLSEKRVQSAVESALKKALTEVQTEDKLLIKLYYFDNLNLRQAGASLGFHEATASRRLVKIQTLLRKRIEEILRTENNWKSDEIQRELANAANVLQTDVENLLKTNGEVQENETKGVQ